MSENLRKSGGGSYKKTIPETVRNGRSGCLGGNGCTPGKDSCRSYR